MEGIEARGEVRRLADVFADGEAEKASLLLRSAVDSHRRTLRTLDNFLQDNRQLRKLVQDLPTKVSYPVMVPFGKAAFFPGKLVHTNEFLVLLGEGYYAECSASKALEILDRRGKLLGSQIAGVKSQLADFDVESRFLNETFAEASAGCVEIREDFVESGSVGTLEPPDFEGASLNSEIEEKLGEGKEVVMTDDAEHELLMARLDEIETAEAAAEMELSNEKKRSTCFNGTVVEFQPSDDEHDQSFSESGCRTFIKALRSNQFTGDKHAQRVTNTDGHGAQESAKVCRGVEGRPSLQSPGDLLKFEEWRRCKSREGDKEITDMKGDHSIRALVKEPVGNARSVDQVAPMFQTELQGGTKTSMVFTGSVVERSEPTPFTGLSQAAPQSQRRPASKFKMRQADK